MYFSDSVEEITAESIGTTEEEVQSQNEVTPQEMSTDVEFGGDRNYGRFSPAFQPNNVEISPIKGTKHFIRNRKFWTKITLDVI